MRGMRALKVQGRAMEMFELRSMLGRNGSEVGVELVTGEKHEVKGLVA